MKLVFIKSSNLKEEPFTTSKVIAECGKVNHHTVTKLIQTYEKDLQEFGILRFQIEEIKGKGQPEKHYKLNEQQATLLITYMKNTLPVREFKKDLVKQFYFMKKELEKRKIERAKGIVNRNALTEAIDKLPYTPHKPMIYRHYTDLAYKLAFGKTTKQLRVQFGIGGEETPRDYLQVAEIARVEKIENEIAVLIEFGNSYSNIKNMMLKKYHKN